MDPMAERKIPKGMSVIELRNGLFRARCGCDWTSSPQTEDRAYEAAVDHARTNGWCYIHRNLTPVGADPIMQED